MKKMISIRKMIATIMVLLLLAFTGITSQAAEAMIGLEPNESNLFSSMGNMLPGETRTDYIVLKNIGRQEATFFLIAESAGEADFDSKELWEISDKLLEQLRMRVVLHQVDSASKISDEGTLLYEGKAHQKEGENALIGRSVRLAQMAAGKGCVIEVSVSVPAWLNNEFDGAEGRFWWKFVSYADESIAPPPVNPGPDPDPNPGPGPGPKPDPNPNPGPDPNPEPGVNPNPEPGINPEPGVEPTTEIPETVTPGVANAGNGGGYTTSYTPDGESDFLSGVEEETDVSEEEPILVVIPDEERPLIDFFTGKGDSNGWSILNLLISILALIGAMITITNILVVKQDDETDKQKKSKRKNWKRHHKLLQGFAVAFGILPVICFLLLEEFSQMQLFSRWTPLILLLAGIDIVVHMIAVFHKQSNVDADSEDSKVKED